MIIISSVCAEQGRHVIETAVYGLQHVLSLALAVHLLGIRAKSLIKTMKNEKSADWFSVCLFIISSAPFLFQ